MVGIRKSSKRTGWFAVSVVSAALILAVGCSPKPDESAEAQAAGAADTAAAPAASFENMPSAEQGQNPPPIPQTPVDGIPQQPPAEQATAPTPPPSDQNTSPPPAPSANNGSGGNGTYTVQKDDTLMKIAFNVYGDIMKWRSIYEANKDKIQDANRLAVGSELHYDKPSTEPQIEKNGDPYLIKRGDTLGSIAGDVYADRSKWHKIFDNNRALIKDANKIYAGFYLYYQMTEEEKQYKASHGGGMQLGSAPTPPAENTAAPTQGTAPASDPTAPVTAAPGTTGANTAPATGGGLTGLMGKAPPSARTPASK